MRLSRVVLAVTLDPNALAIADSLDRRCAAAGPIGALHCIPMIVKDNFETHDLQTTAGSLALKGWIPTRDATMVARVRAAGAIVLAKSNVAEWAFTPYETVSSILPGYTKNPYALDRVTAGSSGGTAAAVAANEGEVGLGSDTGNCIRGPSAHQALVGIRSTMGLTSRAGVVPLSNGATDSEVVAVFTRALDAMKAQGATIVDPAGIDSLPALLRVVGAGGAPVAGGCNPFKFDLERYFVARGENAPVKTVAAVLKSGNYHPTAQARLLAADTVSAPPEASAACIAREAMRVRLRAAIVQLMDSLHLDALVYPTWSNPPRLIGDLNTPHGDNSQLFSPTTGFPAITVPMGYTRMVLPTGMTFFGRPWSEGKLITLACGFEQATHQRHPPASAPPLATTVR